MMINRDLAAYGIICAIYSHYIYLTYILFTVSKQYVSL